MICDRKCLIVFCTLLTHCNLQNHGLSEEYDEKNVEIYELNVPETPKVGEDVRLKCRFRLTPEDHRLRTVSWYRDKDQFFIYKEGLDNPKLFYSFPGIQVQENETNEEMVLLRDVSESTSGEFRCEVMGEGPIFKTVVKSKDMEVIVPPRTMQINITSGKAYYGHGDLIQLNCTAIEAKPRALLSWTVNGNQVPHAEIDHYPALEKGRGRVTTTIGLCNKECWKAPKYFLNNEAHVQCTASVGRHNFTTETTLALDPMARHNYYHFYNSKGSGIPSTVLPVLFSSILSITFVLNTN